MADLPTVVWILLGFRPWGGGSCEGVAVGGDRRSLVGASARDRDGTR